MKRVFTFFPPMINRRMILCQSFSKKLLFLFVLFIGGYTSTFGQVNDCIDDAIDLTNQINNAMSAACGWDCNNDFQHTFSGATMTSVPGGATGFDIWYKFTAAATQTAWLTVYEFGPNISIELYEQTGPLVTTCGVGASVTSGLTFVADASGGCAFGGARDVGICTHTVHSRIDISALNNGTTYYIRLEDGLAPAAGEFVNICAERNFVEAPEADRCPELNELVAGCGDQAATLPGTPAFGAANVNQTFTRINGNNAGAFGNAGGTGAICVPPPVCETGHGIVQVAGGSTGERRVCDTGNFATFVGAGTNNVINNNVMYKFRVNADGCDANVVIKFSNVQICCGGVMQLNVVPLPADGNCDVAFNSIIFDALSSGDCFEYRPPGNTIANGNYLITIDGQDGRLLCYDMDLDITYENCTPTPCCEAPTAMPAMLNECDDGSGSATFTLSDADPMVQGGSGDAVTYYMNADGTGPITTATVAIGDSPATVYATTDNGICESIPVEVTLIVDAQPSIDAINPTDPGCDVDDGIIEVMVSGGMADYTVDVGGAPMTGAGPFTFTGLGEGAYTVTVVDENGCSTTGMTTLTAPTPPSVSSTPTATTCGMDNGSIEVFVSDGTADYTVTIGGTPMTGPGPVFIFSDLPSGPYTVDVTDANDCTATENVTVDDSPPPMVSATAMNAACGTPNGSVEVTVTGGAPNFDVSLNGGAPMSGAGPTFNFTGLAGGMNYTVLVTDDNGCTATTDIMVNEDAAPMVSATAMNASCGTPNGSVEVTVTGGTANFDVSLNGGAPMSGAGPTFNFTGLAGGMNYTVLVTDANGCTATTDIMVNEDAAPMVSATAMNASCGTPNGSVEVTVTGGTPNFDVSLNGGAPMSGAGPTFNFTGLAGGMNYTVLVTDANGCTATTDIMVNEDAAPMVSATAMNASCGTPNGSVEVTVTGGTPNFDVSLNGGAPMSGAGPTFNFTGLAGGMNYTVLVTDANGCTATTDIMVNEDAAPMVSATAMDASCGTPNGSVEVTVTGGTPNFDVSLNGGTPMSGAGPTFNFTGLAGGMNYTVLVTDANGCTATTDIMVNEDAAPMVSATAMDASCGTPNGSVEVTVTGGTPNFDVSLNGGPPMSGAGPTFNFTGLAGGMNYTVLVTDDNGCTATTDIMVNEDAAPMVSATAMDASCGTPNGSVEVTVTGGTPNFDVSLNGGAPMSGAGPTFNFTGLAGGMNYTVLVTDDNGCTATTDIMVNEDAAPMVSATAMDASCGTPNGSVEVTVTGGTPNFDVSLNGGAPMSGAGPTFNFTGLAGGMNYTVLVTDANGCTATTDIMVNEDAAPMVSATAMDASCGTPNGSVEVTVTGGTPNFDVSLNGGAPMSGAGPTFNFTGLAGGMNYSVLVTDANGCTATTDIMVNEDAAPMVSATAIDASCGTPNGSVEVTVTGGTPNFDVSLNGGAPMSGAGPTFNFTGLAGGMNYSVLVTDANGCTTSTDIMVNEDAAPVIASIDVINADCDMPNGSLTINVTGGTPPYDYDVNGMMQSDPNNQYTGLTPNTYNITVTDANGCTVTGTETVGNNPGVAIDNVDVTDANCGMSDGSFTINVTGGAAPFTYDLDGTTMQVNNGTFNGLPAGVYNPIVTDDNGCTATQTVTINDTPGVMIDDFTIMDESCGQMNGSITVNISGGATPFMYQLDGGTAQTSNLFDGLTQGGYTILVTDDNGCTATMMATVGGTNPPVIDDITTTNSSCGNADGSKTVNVSGGTPPYTYECNGVIQNDPNNTFTGLTSGNYTVLVTDATGCTVEGTANITDVGGPSIDDVSPTAAICGMANGSVTITASGMATPLTIRLDGTPSPDGMFDSLLPGMYDIEVEDANGCVATGTVTIDDTPGVMIDNITTTNASCGQADGSKTVIISGGTAPFTFECDGVTQMDNGEFTGMMAGTYSVTVTDANGCTAVSMTTINETDGPTIDNVADANADCGMSNGSLTINASDGIPPYLYDIGGPQQMSNEFTGLPAGNYDVTVTDDNGCTVTQTVTIDDTPGVVIDDIIITNATCGQSDGGKSIEVSGGTPPYTYDCNGVTNNTGVFDGLPSGNYTIIVTDDNGCTDMGTATISDADGPTIDDITVVDAGCGVDDGSVTITISGGGTPYTVLFDGGTQMTSDMITFDMLAAGDYPFEVTDNNGCVATGTATVGGAENPTVDDIQVVDATCGNADGSITITAAGGTAPYTITLNGDMPANPSATFDMLPAGDYPFTITDANGCTVTGTANISDQNGPSIVDISTTNASAGNMDGTISITATGGTPPYTFSIGNGMDMMDNSMVTFTDLPAGDYPVTVTDDNGCIVTGTATVGQDVNDCPTIDMVETTNAACGAMDGTITVTATGGTAPLMYDIGGTPQTSNVFNGVGAGIYTITVTDASGNCNITEMATVSEDGAPTINDIATTNAACMASDGTITIDAMGGVAPLMYDIGGTPQTSNVFNVAAGIYTITVTDANGCSASEMATVGEDGAPTINDIATTNAACMGTDGTITIDAMGGAAPLMYDIGGTPQTSNVFNVAAGDYTITVTDANGCSASEMATVGEDAGPTITDIMTAGSTCGDDNGTATATANGGTTPYMYSINGITFQMDNMFIGLQPGDYIMTVQDTNGCETTEMFTIDDLEAPVVDDIVVVDASCGNADGSITIMAMGGNGPLMYTLDGGTPQPTGVFPMLPAGAYDYTVTDGICTIMGVTTISNVGAPDITSVDVTDASCGTADGTLMVNVTGGVPPLTYTVGGMAPQVDDPNFTGLPAGDVTVVVEDSNGCIGSTVATITESGMLTVDILGNTTICDGDATLLTADPTNAGYDFEWTMNGMTISTMDNAVIMTAGTVTLTATLENSNCTGTASVDVTVVPLPVADAGTDAVIDCDNPTVILDGSGSTGSNLTYNWTTNDGTIVGVNDTPMIEAGSAGTYTLEVTEDIAGCVNTATVEVTQNGMLPIADAGPDMELNCLIQAVTLDGSGSTAGLSYSWTGLDINASNMNQQSPQVTEPGEYILTVTNTANGCSAMSSVMVTQDEDAPVAEIDLVIPLDCFNTEIDIDGSNSTSGPTIVYQWLDNGVPIPGATNPILTVDTPSDYTLVVTNTANGCADSEDITVDDISAFPLVVTNVSGPLTCDVLEVTLDGTGSSTGPDIIYEWFTGGPNGTLVGTGLMIPATDPGGYTLVVTDTSNQCTNNEVIMVVEDMQPPVANAGFDMELDCNDPAGILDGSLSSQGPEFTYMWAGDNNQDISDPTALTPTISEAGLYQITVTDNTNGCTAFSAVVFSENTETPTGVEVELDLPTCQGDNDGIITVTNVEGGTGPFTYSINGGTFFSQNSFPNLMTDSFAIMVQSPNGCIFTDSVFLPDGNDLMIDLGDDIRILVGETATFEAVTNIIPFQIDTLIWNANDSLCGNCFEQNVAPLSTTSYNVFIQDNNGCTAEDDLTIFVNENVEVYLPNVFSPNGDGENDILYVFADPKIVSKVNDFKIYDRWGELVFENSEFFPNDDVEGWDGNLSGKAMDPQVFVYRVEVEFITGEVKTFMGDFTLIK